MAHYPKSLFVRTQKDMFTGVMTTTLVASYGTRDLDVAVIDNRTCRNPHNFANQIADLFNAANENVRKLNAAERYRFNQTHGKDSIFRPKRHRVKTTKKVEKNA